MVKEIYLVRHGHIDTGGEKRYIGQSDIPLDEKGEEQAKALQDFFSSLDIQTVFTSPLQRCIQTAKIICEPKKLPLSIKKDFCEIDMGEWEGLAQSLIQQNTPEAFLQRGRDIKNFTPPHGESFAQLSKRVLKAFHEIAITNQNSIVIVAHAGVNRMILRYILDKKFEDIFTIEQPYGSVYKLTFEHFKQRFLCKRVL